MRAATSSARLASVVNADRSRFAAAKHQHHRLPLGVGQRSFDEGPCLVDGSNSVSVGVVGGVGHVGERVGHIGERVGHVVRRGVTPVSSAKKRSAWARSCGETTPKDDDDRRLT